LIKWNDFKGKYTGSLTGLPSWHPYWMRVYDNYVIKEKYRCLSNNIICYVNPNISNFVFGNKNYMGRSKDYYLNNIIEISKELRLLINN